LSPEPAFFLRTNKNKRSVATLILVDMSGSTNNGVGNGKTRIDVEKEALLVTARAVEAIGDLLSICGFQSDGRDSRKTFFYNFKSFGNLKVQIPDLEPGECNRDGMAIRHATQKILATSAKLKVLMIISDGSPNDDGTEYEGRHAIEDTKKAVEEAKRKGVRPFGIIIGNQNNEIFERIYGKDFINIKEITQLPDRLPVIYKRLTLG
jgi:nitric oxide reductase NorD protein